MKIAIIHEDLKRNGGAENLIVWYTSRMVKMGYDVSLYTGAFEASNWSPAYTEGLPVIVDKCFSFTKNPLFYEIFGRRVLNVLKNVDVVISHNWLNSSLSVAFRGNKQDQRWIWFCQEPPRFIYYDVIDKEILRYMENNLHYSPYRGLNIMKHRCTRSLLPMFKILDKNYVTRNFNDIVANSHFTARNVKKIYGNQAKTAHLGVDVEKSLNTHENMKNELGCEYLFLASGRISPEKNVYRMIKALSKLDNHFDYKLVIAGNGEGIHFLKQKVKELGLATKVVLPGFIGTDKLHSFMHSCDMVVYIPINEPFGLVPIEALARGKPSLVSSTGGPSETIQDNVTGFHVDPLNVDAISERMEHVLEHPSILKDMKSECLKAYESRFTLRHGVARFLHAAGLDNKDQTSMK